MSMNTETDMGPAVPNGSSPGYRGQSDNEPMKGQGAMSDENNTENGNDEAAVESENMETTVSAVFGEIVWLLAQSPNHRHVFIGDLEWLVMTPMLLNQYKVYRAEGKPVGVALWAYVDDEVQARIKSGENRRLSPQDWKCGEKRVLVELVAPFGGREEMLEDFEVTGR